MILEATSLNPSAFQDDDAILPSAGTKLPSDLGLCLGSEQPTLTACSHDNVPHRSTEQTAASSATGYVAPTPASSAACLRRADHAPKNETVKSHSMITYKRPRAVVALVLVYVAHPPGHSTGANFVRNRPLLQRWPHLQWRHQTGKQIWRNKKNLTTCKTQTAMHPPTAPKAVNWKSAPILVLQVSHAHHLDGWSVWGRQPRKPFPLSGLARPEHRSRIPWSITRPRRM